MEGQDQQPFDPSFILAALNEPAKQVVLDRRNKHWLRQNDDGSPGIYIAFDRHEGPLEYVFGRGDDVDVYIPDFRNADISKKQCSFKLNPYTGAVILRDHSSHDTTTAASPQRETFISFASRRRTVLVARTINRRVSIGKNEHARFEIRWISDGLHDFPPDEGLVTGPRRATQRRYVQGERLGSGMFGSVFRALDVFNGNIIAVKVFHELEGKSRTFARREAVNLFKINADKNIRHDHILEILETCWGDGWGEILMPMKDGSLKDVLKDYPHMANEGIADIVLYQMLLALKCTDEHKIVHRDIKPENILYTYNSQTNSYLFQLGDFGLSNDIIAARTMAGTPAFMAPEVWHRKKQTTAVDIWSLFATVVWVHNVEGFREQSRDIIETEVHDWLARIAKHKQFKQIKDMGRVDPAKRPSAKDLLKRMPIVTSPQEDDDEGSSGADAAAAAYSGGRGKQVDERTTRVSEVIDQLDDLSLSPGAGDTEYHDTPYGSYNEPAHYGWTADVAESSRQGEHRRRPRDEVHAYLDPQTGSVLPAAAPSFMPGYTGGDFAGGAAQYLNESEQEQFYGAESGTITGASEQTVKPPRRRKDK